MFKKILYPTDFSPVASRALPYVRQLKATGSNQVILLHIIEAKATAGVSLDAFPDEKTKEEAHEKLESVKSELIQEGFDVEVKLRIGVPSDEILRLEEEENVSVTIMGSHGTSNLKDMIMGSVTKKVVGKCKNPILVIKR
jgi:nucleotide-binding universal stress UspA family protein